ncbi:MAG TPA: ATP-binding protein [Saprospiraceae bacterium]|nr:ATP-binding protein [Saprospiraceae bacterium]HMQ82233.1 ATP-binding protein [Saprospiraceae bacterium]
MFKLYSNPCNLSKIESFVEQVVQKYKLSPDVSGNMLLSLTEAVNNAIIHGNNNDETKTVRIQLKKRQGCLAISVSDEGRGFDINKVPDPTAPENIYNPGGRGVFLIKQVCDGVAYSNNGSTVEMEFRI